MAHKVKVTMTVPEMSKVDTTYEIKQDGIKLGTLKISKGGIEYIPKGYSRTTTKKNWRQLHEMLLPILILVFLPFYSISQRTGKGNSTFIPDITYSTKFLKTLPTIKNLEQLLPQFSVSDSSISYSGNKETGQFDIINSIDYQYKFIYSNKFGVTVLVKTNLKHKITGMEYHFDMLPTFFNENKQLATNGYYYNSRSSLVATKLNFGKPLDFYDSGNMHVVLEWSIHKFEIFRSQK